ncbi:hypothetical protein JVU11DRAFT_8395 [Chiua virens]|nr:hypothetical protein JVU11DRAFT_8395 [Chiua virens]
MHRYSQGVPDNFQARIRDDQGENQSRPPNQLQPEKRAIPIPSTMTMSRGYAGSGKGTKVGMDALTWLSNVRVGEKRDESSSRDSGMSSGSRSRASHRMDGDTATGHAQKRKRSESRLREGKDTEAAQSLPDDFLPSKIRLEKHDLTKKRACTLGLHGPWGESSSVFIRISFKFPKSYPHAPHPEGTPEIDVERSPLISMQNRAFMLRRLKTIRERRRPCLELCLRFLLFGDENEQVGIPMDMGSESSSEEDDGPPTRKSRDFTVSLLRNNKNLAEPRTSQGIFGPNGELICFFRAPPRIVRPHQGNELSSPSGASRTPRFFQSPALLSDAVRRLGLAAIDQRPDMVPRRLEDGEHTLRVMTNLLTFSQQRTQWGMAFETKDNAVGNDQGSNISMITYSDGVRWSSESRPRLYLPGEKLPQAYIFQASTLEDLCRFNADVAREHGQFAHERMFRTLQSLFPAHEARQDVFGVVTHQIVNQMSLHRHREFCVTHDVQMLAMLAVVLLRAYLSSAERSLAYCLEERVRLLQLVEIQGPPSGHIVSAWPRLSSASETTANYVVGSSPSNSSRGSWSSLFNTGSVRQFMSGVHESISTPLDALPGKLTVSIPPRDTALRLPNLESPRTVRRKTSTVSPISKSWSESQMVSPLTRHSPFSSASQVRRPERVHGVDDKLAIQEKKLVVLDEDPPQTRLEPELLSQLACHILVYADMLFSWQLLNKRIELLNTVKTSSFVRTPPHESSDMRFDTAHVRRRATGVWAVRASTVFRGRGDVRRVRQSSDEPALFGVPTSGQRRVFRTSTARSRADGAVSRACTKLWAVFAPHTREMLAGSTIGYVRDGVWLSMWGVRVEPEEQLVRSFAYSGSNSLAVVELSSAEVHDHSSYLGLPWKSPESEGPEVHACC